MDNELPGFNPDPETNTLLTREPPFFHKHRFRIVGILAILAVLTSFLSKGGSNSVSDRDSKKDRFQGRMAGALGEGGVLPANKPEVKKGQSLGIVGSPSADLQKSKELDPSVMEKLKKEIALKAEFTRRKSLLAGEEVSSPQGGLNENQSVRNSNEDFAPEGLEASKPGTQDAVMESLRQKTLFSEDSPKPKVEEGEQVPVDPYEWLKSIKECDKAFDFFRARYAPFGPYSELTLERKRDVDGAIRILCGAEFSQCKFDLCGIPRKGEDTRDPDIIRAEYVELLAARNSTRADIVKAGRKESKGKKRTWRRFSLEERPGSPGSGEKQATPPAKERELTASEKRYYDARRRRSQRKNR